MHWLALLLSTDADVHELHPSARQDALAWWALRFSPRVARLEEAVVLEVEASLRLFGGRLALHERLRREAAEQGLPLAAVAWAPNSLAALTLARAGVTEGLERPLSTLLDPLPITLLSALAAHRPLLARLGLKRLGDVRRLPRPALARRLGPEPLLALDRVYADPRQPPGRPKAGELPLGGTPEYPPAGGGMMAEPAHAWEVLPERFALRRELRERIEHAPVLLHAAEPLLVQAGAWLAARHAGLRAFTLHWAHDAMRARGVEGSGALSIATAHVTRDLAHLRRLLGEHLARTRLAAPVGEIALHIDEAVPLKEHSAELLPGSRLHDGEALDQLLERMAVRLGTERVRRGRVEDDHRPERSQHWAAWRSEATLDTPAARPRLDSPQPSWLLDPPERLQVVNDQPHYLGPLQLLAGPQRIEGGWWQLSPDGQTHGQAQRDYFIARSAQAGLLWIYSQRFSLIEKGWFLHGFFA
jgi:protein ImuB